MSHKRPFTFIQGLTAACVAGVVLVMLAPLRPGSPMKGGSREASVIPLLAANGLADTGAFHRLEYKPVLCASEEPQFLKLAAEKTGDRRLRVVTVRKKVLPLEVDLRAPRVEWAHLTERIRDEIDLGSEKGRDIRVVTLHGSGGLGAASPKAMSRLHRWILGSQSGVAYDFIIGDESDSAAIQAGDRWRDPGASDGELRLCLMGDFESEGPTATQLEALHELIDYLRVRLGHVRVSTHAKEAGRPVSCMGPGFPEAAILEALNPQ